MYTYIHVYRLLFITEISIEIDVNNLTLKRLTVYVYINKKYAAFMTILLLLFSNKRVSVNVRKLLSAKSSVCEINVGLLCFV